jgi:predicted Zn-dependent protease
LTARPPLPKGRGVSNDALFRKALAAFQSGDLQRARASAEQLASSSWGHGAAEHLLGLIHCRTGAIDSGIAHLRRAHEIDPSNPGFRAMLVRALVDSGAHRDAFELAARPTAAEDGNAMLWHARAEAADAAGERTAAAEAWIRVAALQPGDWRAWSNAGNAYAGLGQWPQAADALRNAVRFNPDEHQIRRNFVSALGQSGHMEEAAREVETLLATDPDDGAARMLWAKALSELGKNQESLDQYDEAVSRALNGDPANPGASLLELGRRAVGPDTGARPNYDIDLLRSVAALLDRTNRIAALRDFLDAAAAVGIEGGNFPNSVAGLALRDGNPEEARRILLDKGEAGDAVYHNRMLARVEEALGNPAAAFAASVAMNRSVADYDEWRKKAAAYRGRVRRVRREAEQTLGSITPLEPDKRPSPSFLVGFPRSGTTLLDTFLMGHPDTAVLEEVHLLGAAAAALGGTARLDRRSKDELERARNAYFVELDRHVDPGFAGLVVDKLPLNIVGLPFIYALFPDARIIFAQRHPCDCVLSCLTQSFVLNDAMASFLELDDSADMYDAVLDHFTFTRENLTLGVHDLIYEQLVAEPAATLKPLIHFLGLEWRAELLDHQATARSRGAIITPSYDQVVEPLSRAPSGRWRRYEQQLKPVLPVLLPWARRLGYAD